jgi:hypothetical protein
MTSWQIWQALTKGLGLGAVMLFEQIISMPVLSLLLVYWWFGRAKHNFYAPPIIAFSGALGLLHGGSLVLVYVLLGVWWWFVTRKTEMHRLQPLVLFGSACIVALLLVLANGRVQWQFALSWSIFAAVVWWRLNLNKRSSKHVV